MANFSEPPNGVRSIEAVCRGCGEQFVSRWSTDLGHYRYFCSSTCLDKEHKARKARRYAQ